MFGRIVWLFQAIVADWTVSALFLSSLAIVNFLASCLAIRSVVTALSGGYPPLLSLPSVPPVYSPYRTFSRSSYVWDLSLLGSVCWSMPSVAPSQVRASSAWN